MGLIESVLHFVLCECGAHGYFVTADGNVGPRIYSKQAANIYLDTLLAEKLAQKDEVDVARKVILSSKLPSKLTIRDVIGSIETSSEDLTPPFGSRLEKINVGPVCPN